MIKLKPLLIENDLRIFRGESVHNRGGNFWATDPEQARQYTQAGRDREILTAYIDSSRVYKANPPPFFGDEKYFDQVMEYVVDEGYPAFWVDEGRYEPPSIFVVNKFALRKMSRLK